MVFSSYGYLTILVISLIGLGLYDRSRGLALLAEPKRTLLTVASSVVFFVAWDVAGINLGIFQTNPAYVTGLYVITPNLPVEELLLLTLISYLVLLLTRALARQGM